jgi:hypothetical protein
MSLEIKDNKVIIQDQYGNIKFSTDRRLTSIIFRQSGTITVTDYDYQAPIIIKEHPAIVSDTDKFFMFISYNIWGGEINSRTESVNGMGSVLLGIYKDTVGYFAGSMVLDFVSTNGILYAVITKNVKSGAKIDWSNVNYGSAPNVLVNYSVQYCRIASNLVPSLVPIERLDAEMLLVGGGGGGGGGSVGMSAGGGGAGEFKEYTTKLEVDKSYNLYVGLGGNGGGDLLIDGFGQRGETTTFYRYNALGGAGGGNGSLGGNFRGHGGPGSYGSGSGASGGDQYWVDRGATLDSTGGTLNWLTSLLYATPSFSATPISDTAVPGGPSGGQVSGAIEDFYTNKDGSVTLVPTVTTSKTHKGGQGYWYNGGGGGGAGAAGVDAQIPGNKIRDDPGTNIGGVGGIGFASAITGSSEFYAAGGSGGTIGNTQAISASGIGGVGGSKIVPTGGNAVANTGSGGGGKGFSPIINDIMTGYSKGTGTTLIGNNTVGGIYIPLSTINSVVNTAFLSQLSVGDVIHIEGQTRTITGVTNNYTASVTPAFDPAITNVALVKNLSKSKGHKGGNGGSGIIVLKIPDQYTASFTEGVDYEHITSVNGYNIYKITETQTQYERVKISK